MDAADDHKEKESGLPDPVVKLSDLISSSQDTWGLDNRHKAEEKVGRVGGLEVCTQRTEQDWGRQEVKGKDGSCSAGGFQNLHSSTEKGQGVGSEGG